MVSGLRHDGRAFLTIEVDGTAKIRDTTTGEALGRIPSASSPTTCAVFRGDDGLVTAGFGDGAVRLYAPATNQLLGPPRFLRHAVARVAFTSNGRSVAAVDWLGETSTWLVPELLDGNLDEVTLRIEARTGLRMDTGPALSRLNPPAWQARLEQLGRLDPHAMLPDRDPGWQTPLLRKAEENGNAFAAIWHLDQSALGIRIRCSPSGNSRRLPSFAGRPKRSWRAASGRIRRDDKKKERRSRQPRLFSIGNGRSNGRLRGCETLRQTTEPDPRVHAPAE